MSYRNAGCLFDILDIVCWFTESGFLLFFVSLVLPLSLISTILLSSIAIYTYGIDTCHRSVRNAKVETHVAR